MVSMAMVSMAIVSMAIVSTAIVSTAIVSIAIGARLEEAHGLGLGELCLVNLARVLERRRVFIGK